MGTKNAPAPFDCYANAEPDEPMFVLLARDRVGALTVRMWAALRVLSLNGDAAGIDALVRITEAVARLVDRADAAEHHPDEVEQIAEALDCADAMQQWREANR